MRLAGLILIALLRCSLSTAQPCERLDIKDKKQQKILHRFIHECKRKGFLAPKLGYIQLTEWLDEQGQLQWQVAALKEWQSYSWIDPFLQHCTQCIAPVGWTKVDNRLVVRYRLDRPSDTLTKAQSSCLLNIVTNHATIFSSRPIPPKEVVRKDAYGQPILDKAGKPIMQPYFGTITAGNGGGNNTHIIFKTDGSIEKGLSL